MEVAAEISEEIFSSGCHCCRSESTGSCLSPVTTAFFLGFEDFLLMWQCFVGLLKYKLGAWILQEDVLEIILLRERENENLPQLLGVFSLLVLISSPN